MLIHYRSSVTDNNYKPASGRSVTVKYKSGATATIYSSKAGAISGNPLTANSNGEIEFWAAAGEYTLAAGTEEQDITIEEALGQTEIVAVPISTSIITLNGYEGNAFKAILTEDVTLAFSNIVTSDNGVDELTRYELFVAQDATGSWEITFPGSVTFLEGSEQQPRSGANVVTKYTLDTYDEGTTWLVSVGGGATTYGDVFGPASSTDNALALFDSTTGKVIKNSNWTMVGDKLTAAGNLDMADNSFEDDYLTTPVPLSEAGTTNLSAAFAASSIIAALNENNAAILALIASTFNTYNTVALAEAGTGADNTPCYVVETESYYRNETDGGAYTRDGTYILNTGNGGNTRWLAVSGKYVYGDINMYGQGNIVRRDEWLQNGFVDQSDHSTMTFSDSTPDRTLSLQPTATSFDFYEEGIKYTSTGDTVVITDVEGEHVVYYDGGVLTALANPTDDQISTVIRTKCIVSYLYWNATANEHIYFGEERHGFNMNPITHTLLHFRDGLIYMFGLGLSGFSVDGDGSSDTHSQFGVDLGAIADEDIFSITSAVAPTTGLPVLYFDGANGDLRKGTNAGYSALVTTTKPDWNEWTGAVWQRTEMTDDYYAWVHALATTDIDNEIFAHMGLAEYATDISAKRGLEAELEQFINGTAKIAEYRYIGSVLILANSAYTNTNNYIVASTLEGEDYYDLRTANMSRQIVDLGIDEAALYMTEAYISTPATTTLTAQNSWYPIKSAFTNDILEGFSLEAVSVNDPDGIVCDADFTQFYRYLGQFSFESDTLDEDFEFAIIMNGTLVSGDGSAISNTANIISKSIRGTHTRSTGENYYIGNGGKVQLGTDDKITLIARCTSGAGRVITVNYGWVDLEI